MGKSIMEHRDCRRDENSEDRKLILGKNVKGHQEYHAKDT